MSNRNKLILAGLGTVIFIIGLFTTVIGLISFGKWMIG
tara:strand:- start:28264 stop:28377 length:114 start_codon:yes stop_codon:yes gene_type:complete